MAQRRSSCGGGDSIRVGAAFDGRRRLCCSASKDLLEWVTHSPPGDVIDGYTTLPWEALCEQVLCIRVERREGKVIALPVGVAAGGGSTSFQARYGRFVRANR